MPQTIADTSSAFSKSVIASTLPNITGMIRDNVSDASPLLSFVMGKLGGSVRKFPGGEAGNLGNGLPGTIVGGRDIMVPVQLYENTTVGSYANADPLDISHQDTDRYALYPIRQLAGSINIVGSELRGNTGEPAIYNLLQAKTSRLMEDMRQEANRMLVADGTGNGGKDFVGLAGIVSTSTLAGIDPATDVKWQPGGFPSTVTARHGIISSFTFTSGTGLDNMRKLINRLTFGSDGVGGIFFSTPLWEDYVDAMEANVRYTSVGTGDASFKTVEYQGIPVFFDHALPTAAATNVGYFINPRHLAFARRSNADFSWLSDDLERPVNQDVYVNTNILEGNFITDNRRLLGGFNTVTA